MNWCSGWKGMLCNACLSVDVAALRCLSYVTPPPAACVITPLRGARLGSRGRQSGVADWSQPRVIF